MALKCEIRLSRQITLGTNEASNSECDNSDLTFSDSFFMLVYVMDVAMRGERAEDFV